ncbi:hypothetical protein A6770_14620 [Nostoc minutum NIES-26]|uniref:Glucosamine inositolphosphorylceramide transferase 1 N-terminal domain-containing protein n=1 Tax=Nostoc minutum NIES-26 TaxID=1844469 RepID=A0A367RLD0_9NOSO|nr:hypothetical protein [Dendronalium sp. ChiSLP03b]MDZ8204104.1 hypothetical protein [Dendronalium sp. ChiSLP03b]RCJ37358.1 hypothetical protein A6770_14620 [Nostoc minutum NIES-26]
MQGTNFMKKLVKKIINIDSEWSIAIYTGESPLNLVSPKSIKNPILTAKHVTDVPAEFVADPFMLHENDTWYMFFEVLNARTNKGDIGLATSKDCLNWNYQKIVLEEPFHLSYPYVFKWNHEYYMIPETAQASSVRLYKATSFPTQWTFCKTLLSGEDFVDPTIFQHNDLWWLFTATAAKRNILRLYYSQQPTGPWIEHPQSPVIKGNAKIARPGGRTIVFNEKIFRYTQDCEYIYGKQVLAFEITELTTANYQEKAVKSNPIIKASGYGWNKVGMHNIDPHQIDNNKWIACVDGRSTQLALNSNSRLALWLKKLKTSC